MLTCTVGAVPPPALYICNRVLASTGGASAGLCDGTACFWLPSPMTTTIPDEGTGFVSERPVPNSPQPASGTNKAVKNETRDTMISLLGKTKRDTTGLRNTIISK